MSEEKEDTQTFEEGIQEIILDHAIRNYSQIMSDDIGKLAEALSKAQGVMQSAHKNKDNPYFKSNYSDLDSCWDACRDPLSKNGLAVTQCHRLNDKGDLVLDTLLIHSSGQWIKGTLQVRPTKNDPQMMVSATTYARRAGLCAIVGISPADDDGNAASGKTSTAKPKPKPKPAKGKSGGKKAETSKKTQPESDDGDDGEDDDF